MLINSVAAAAAAATAAAAAAAAAAAVAAAALNISQKGLPSHKPHLRPPTHRS